MSAVSTPEGSVHFQSLGRGEPVILLHGWLSSWDVWRNFMPALASARNYRVYALDFWGFGASRSHARNGAQGVSLAGFVTLIGEFMDRMGIAGARLLGHSMGGTVALQFALAHPERVESVTAVCAPLSGRLMNPALRMVGAEWLGRAARKRPALVGPTIRPATGFVMRALLAREAPEVRRMIQRDLRRTTLASYVHSIADLRRTDMGRALSALRVPVLGIFGGQDNIVSPRNADVLARAFAPAETLILRNSRHFPMFAEPDAFLRALGAFFARPRARCGSRR